MADSEERVTPGRGVLANLDINKLAEGRKKPGRKPVPEEKDEIKNAEKEENITSEISNETNKDEEVTKPPTTNNETVLNTDKQVVVETVELPSEVIEVEDEQGATDSQENLTLDELLSLDVDEEDGLISGKRENLRVTEFTKEKVQLLMTLIGTDFINETIHKSLDLAAETLDPELKTTYQLLLKRKAEEYRKKGLSTSWKYKDKKSLNKK